MKTTLSIQFGDAPVTLGVCDKWVLSNWEGFALNPIAAEYKYQVLHAKTTSSKAGITSKEESSFAVSLRAKLTNASSSYNHSKGALVATVGIQFGDAGDYGTCSLLDWSLFYKGNGYFNWDGSYSEYAWVKEAGNGEKKPHPKTTVYHYWPPEIEGCVCEEGRIEGTFEELWSSLVSVSNKLTAVVASSGYTAEKLKNWPVPESRVTPVPVDTSEPPNAFFSPYTAVPEVLYKAMTLAFEYCPAQKANEIVNNDAKKYYDTGTFGKEINLDTTLSYVEKGKVFVVKDFNYKDALQPSIEAFGVEKDEFLRTGYHRVRVLDLGVQLVGEMTESKNKAKPFQFQHYPTYTSYTNDSTNAESYFEKEFFILNPYQTEGYCVASGANECSGYHMVYVNTGIWVIPGNGLVFHLDLLGVAPTMHLFVIKGIPSPDGDYLVVNVVGRTIRKITLVINDPLFMSECGAVSNKNPVEGIKYEKLDGDVSYYRASLDYHDLKKYLKIDVMEPIEGVGDLRFIKSSDFNALYAANPPSWKFANIGWANSDNEYSYHKTYTRTEILLRGYVWSTLAKVDDPNYGYRRCRRREAVNGNYFPSAVTEADLKITITGTPQVNIAGMQCVGWQPTTDMATYTPIKYLTIDDNTVCFRNVTFDKPTFMARLIDRQYHGVYAPLKTKVYSGHVDWVDVEGVTFNPPT